jgi:putative colanic acid biosynthesis acetyltransferase WcaF
LRLFGAKIGAGVLIRPSVSVTYPWKLSIGDRSWIGDGVTLYSLDLITIGSDTVISHNCVLCAAQHNPDSVAFDIFGKPIVIGSECWLADDVFVAPGVSVGDGTVVGARSSVFKSLPGGMICYGTPAQVVRAR